MAQINFQLWKHAVMVIAVLIPAAELTCVENRNTTLRNNYFDPLRDALNLAPPPDINIFLCDNATHKALLDGIITEFKNCPDFNNETSMLDELQHNGSEFHAEELFHVASADLFCECSPNITCLTSVNDSAMLVQVSDHRAWSKMPNPDYICGAGKSDLECLGKLLPQCEAYYNFKLNHSEGENFTVAFFEYGDIYASKYCGAQKDNHTTYTCVIERANRNSLTSCVEMASLYSSEADRSCGLRRCIDLEMESCPAEQIDYFVNAVNVFSMDKVSTHSCPSKGAFVFATIPISLVIHFLVSTMNYVQF